MKRNRLTQKILKRQQLPPLRSRLKQLSRWLQTSSGKALLEEQQKALTPRLEALFGYHLLQLSAFEGITLYRDSKIRHCFTLGLNINKSASAVTPEQALPLASDSIDVAIAHHVLEYNEDSRELLRELARVVLPSGHLVISGFNPRSLLLFWTLAAKFRSPTSDSGAVWNAHFLSIPRLADWLALLGFSIQSVDYGYYRMPVNIECLAFLDKLWLPVAKLCAGMQLPVGGFYIIIAKKEVSILTRIKAKSFRQSAVISRLDASFFHQPKRKNETLH